jgi:LmbE family N-acetylglucosaminyl deacetylase
MPLRLLACFAHPDDEAFTGSGVLATCTARGVDIRLVCATRGEAGDIRTPEVATRENLADVRAQELRESCRVLGVQEPIVLGYRDSGWGDDPAQHHPQAFVNAPASAVVRQLVKEVRRFRPHIVLTFEPSGISGHKDHIAISTHTTFAYQVAGDPAAFPEQVTDGLKPYSPQRLFYIARLQGYRVAWVMQLRQAGFAEPLPPLELHTLGVPREQIHWTLDVSAHLDTKLASMRCHRTQIPPDWPYLTAPQDVALAIHGTEYLIQAHPPVPTGSTLEPDFLAGLQIEE